MAHNVNAICFNCWGPSSAFQEESDDVYCTNCGCAQRMGPMTITSYDTASHVEYYAPPVTTQESVLKALRSMTKYFDETQNDFHVSDSVMNTARDIITALIVAPESLLKSRNKQAYVLAAVYYATRRTEMPLSRKRVTDARTPDDAQAFTRACKDIEDALKSNTAWADLFVAKETKSESRYMQIVWPIVSRLKIQHATSRKIFKAVSAIMERIVNDNQIKALQPSTYAAGLVYVAVKVAKIEGVSMNAVSAASGVTVNSIISADKEVRAAIIRNPKAH